MLDRTANLLGALGLAVTDRIAEVAREVMNRAGETPAALVVIGYGGELTNEQLRSVLQLSHLGTVRLVDRLVVDGLVERRTGRDRRTVALFLTAKGDAAREALLADRLAALRPLLAPLTDAELESFAGLLHRILGAVPASDMERCRLCRMCDDRVCIDCPVPAAFKTEGAAG